MESSGDLVALYRAQVSHPGVAVEAPSDLLDAIDDTGFDAAVAWLAGHGIDVARIGGAVPVEADGVLADGRPWRFRARGTSAALHVHPEASLTVHVSDLRRDPSGAVETDADGWPVFDRRSASTGELGAVAVIASERAWRRWLAEERWRSEDPLVATGADMPALWPKLNLTFAPVVDDPDSFGLDKPVWSGHVDGAACFGWTSFEAGWLSPGEAARLVAVLAAACPS